MGFTYKHRKLRDEVRARYTAETGRDDFRAPEFEAWLIATYPDLNTSRCPEGQA